MTIKTEEDIIKNWDDNIGKPFVSICCTTYNHENFIAKALDGFLMQETDFAFEVIVRDDASVDKTAEIIKEYEKKYPNIIKPIYEAENGFKKGIRPIVQTFKKATGKYIAICEGDDYWTDPKKLQIQKDFLDKNKDYVICYHEVKAFNENGIVEDYVGGSTTDLSEDELKKATPINTLTTMFRNIISEIPVEMNASLYGDLFLWTLLGTHGKGKFIKDIKPAMYRLHDGGIHSATSYKDKHENLLITYALLLSYHKKMGNRDIVEYFKKSILFRLIRTDGLWFIVSSIVKQAFSKLLNYKG